MITSAFLWLAFITLVVVGFAMLIAPITFALGFYLAFKRD